MSKYKTTYHRDGTVTVWDCHLQQWRKRVPADDVANNSQLMSTLNSQERARIEEMASKWRDTYSSPKTT